MRKYIRTPLYKLLDLEQGELKPVLLLLALSFFLGIGVITFDIGSTTIFLEVFQKDRISEAFLVSGLVGVCTTFIFAFLQKRIPFSILVFSTLFFVLGIIGLYSFLLVYLKQAHYVRYFIFVSLGSINALVLLCFYGIIGRAFNIRSQKRLTSKVDQGQMFAIVTAFFVVFLIPESVPVVDYFYFSLVALFISILFYLFFIYKHSTEKLTKINRQEEKDTSTDYKQLIKNKYFRLLAQFSLLSIMLLQFMEFSFFSAGVEAYKEIDANGNAYINDIDLAKFLAGYGTILTLFNMLFQLVGAKRVVSMVGVKFSLFVLPILLIIFSSLTVIIGVFFGDTKFDTLLGINETFILFFIFVCLSKLFLQTCVDSFEEPIFKNFFLPINSTIRHDVQTKVEGTFRQFAIVIAGGFLIVFGLLSLELIYFSLALIVIASIYAYVIIKLYNEYKSTLYEALRIQSGKIDMANDINDMSIQSVLLKELQTNNEYRIVHTLKMMEYFDPILFEKTITNFLNHPSLLVQKYTYSKIEKLQFVHYKHTIQKISQIENVSDETKLLVESTLQKLSEAENFEVRDEDIVRLSKSKQNADKQLAVTLIRNNFNMEIARRLFDLLRDANVPVRKAALLTAGSIQLSKYRMLLIDNLSLPAFAAAASSGLYLAGKEVVPSLELAFYKTGQHIQTKIRIIQLYARIGGDAAIEALWAKVSDPDRNVISEALLAIRNLGYVATGERANKVKYLLIYKMRLCAWKIAALTEIGEDFKPTPLYQALIEEIEEDDEHIFMLLSVIYHASSVKLVEESLKSNTVEGIMYGIELLEVFVDTELKPMLIPLLDQISILKKNEILKRHFLRAKYDPLSSLYQLINKDYNEINRWTKACAIPKLLLVKNRKITNTLIANLFHPDKLIREISAYVIYSISPEKYMELSIRMQEKHKKEMDALLMVDSLNAPKTLMFAKILFLKTMPVFSRISGALLANLVDYIEEVEYKSGTVLYQNALEGKDPIIIIYKGMLTLTQADGKVVSECSEKYILGDKLMFDIDSIPVTVTAAVDTIVFRIAKDRYFDVVSMYYPLAKTVLPNLNNDVEMEQDASFQHVQLNELN